MLKRGSAEKIDDFLKIPEMITEKKRRLINASKRKLALQKQKPETVIITLLDDSVKKDMPIPPQTPTLGTKEVDVVMIGANAYRAACRLKGAQVFAVSMRDLEYQAEKEARPETDPRNVVTKKYHDLLNVFSKKDSDTLPPHQKYVHKTTFKEKQKYGHAPLAKMSL